MTSGDPQTLRCRRQGPALLTSDGGVGLQARRMAASTGRAAASLSKAEGPVWAAIVDRVHVDQREGRAAVIRCG